MNSIALLLVMTALVATSLPGGPTHAGRPDTQPEERGSAQTRSAQAGAKAGVVTQVRLNRIIYQPGSQLSATVTVGPGDLNAQLPALIVSTSESKDVEAVRLRPGGAPSVLTTEAPLAVESATSGGVKQWDGRLSVKHGEIFFAIYFTPPNGRDPARGKGGLVTDFGLMEDRQLKGAEVRVVPTIALTDDERRVPPGGKRIGTLAARGGLALQVPLEELIIYPRDQQQLELFLRETRGRVLKSTNPRSGTVQRGGASPAVEASGAPPRDRAREARKGYLVQVSTDGADVEHLAQMRALFKEKGALLASSPETLRIYALAMQYRLDGFAVAVNPRLQFMDAPSTRDGTSSEPLDFMSTDGGLTTPAFSNGLFGVRRAWAYTALWDKDTQAIPVAFLDQGFAPNWDFRGYPGPFLAERSIADGTSGPGTAVDTPTVGNSLFGKKSWHGTGVVTAAGGVLNNGWGAAGTGGQVVTPMLYEMDLLTYAFEMEDGMKQAVDDGAAIINISACYPCTLVSNVGPDFGICDEAGRLALCMLLTESFALAVEAAAAAVAAACESGVVVIPVFGQAACAGALAALAFAKMAQTAAIGVCLATLLPGDPRGPMEEGVDYAASHGVPIVSTAGNTPNPENLGPLCEAVECGPGDVKDWQIVPCVLDGVICVGAADDEDPYGNLHYYGDRVDVWAPIPITFFGPPSIQSVTGPAEQVRNPPGSSGGLSGTSAAAPYVSGIVAMMMAVNPKLNPRTSSLSSSERAAIPQTIRSLLKNTATPKASLPIGSGADTLKTVVRRNLVNAFAAVKSAAELPGQASIPNFEVAAPLFGDGLGFDEGSDKNDTPQSAKVIELTPGKSVEPVTGVILRIRSGPGPGVTSQYVDEDWFVLKTPQTSGVYKGGVVKLKQPLPSLWGGLYLNGQQGALVNQTSLSETREFALPDMFPDSCFPVKVAGELGADNRYRLEFSPPTPAPPLKPDAFDTPPGNTNNIQIGTGSSYDWKSIPIPPDLSGAVEQIWEIKIPDLNIHRKDDYDNFILSVPPGWLPTKCDDCRPFFEIETAPNLSTKVYGVNLEIGPDLPPLQLLSETTFGSVDLYCSTYLGGGNQSHFPLQIRLGPMSLTDATLPEGCASAAGPASYDLLVRLTIPNYKECKLAKKLKGTKMIPFPIPDKAGPVEEAISKYNPDAVGRLTRADRYLIEWRGGESFRLLGEIEQGQALALQLLDLRGNVIAQAVTDDLRDQFRRSTAARNVGEITNLMLEAPRLPPGFYILSVSHARPNTKARITLPRNAISDGSPSLEDRTTSGGRLREVLRPAAKGSPH